MSLIDKYISFLLICVACGVANSDKVYQLGVNGPSDREAVKAQEGIEKDNVLIDVGYVGENSRLYFDVFGSRVPIIDDYIEQNYTFIAIPGNLTRIIVYEVGDSQNVTATIVEGGLGCWYVTVNILTEISLGYKVNFEIYGTIIDRSTKHQAISHEEFLKRKRDLECEEIEYPPTDPPTTPDSTTVTETA